MDAESTPETRLMFEHNMALVEMNEKLERIANSLEALVSEFQARNDGRR